MPQLEIKSFQETLGKDMCGPASLKVVLDYYGLNKSEQELADVAYPGGWRFLGLPHEEAKDIKETFGKSARGWGSFPVSVTIGAATWETSIFPDKKSGRICFRSRRRSERPRASKTIRPCSLH